MSESVSMARQLFSKECEAGINKQINMELEASYAYLAFSSYFDRDTVAMPKVAKFFRKMADEEHGHAKKFIEYQNKRGGVVVFQDIKKPSKITFANIQEAMETSLNMEKAVNESLLKLHGVSTEQNDPQFCDFLESEYLEEQVESIKEFANFVTQAKRTGQGLGEYLFERLSLD